MKKIAYKVLKRYPGLNKDIAVGDIVVKTFIDSLYKKLSSDKEYMLEEYQYIAEFHLEELPEFFEKIEIEIIIK